MNTTMGFLRGIAPVVLGLLILLAGLTCFGLAIDKIRLDQLLLALEDPRHYLLTISLYLAGAALVILGLLWMWSTVGGRSEGTLECPSEGGRVLIQAGTARDFVRQIAESVPGVMSASPQSVRQHGGVTTVSVAITPDFDQPVSTVAAQVQEKLRKELERTLGLPAVQDVNVSIQSPGKKTLGSTVRTRKGPMDDIKGEEASYSLRPGE